MTREQAQRVLDWRAEIEEERLLEQVNPELIRGSLRLEQSDIERGCVDLNEVVDIGRALFNRTFTRSEGHGHGEDIVRFHRGRFGGPDAMSCQSCHWKSGAAGAGDRADNGYFYGDGDDVSTSDVRNPPALWGSGWMELVAREMSSELLRTADELLVEAEASATRTSRALSAKGVEFGTLVADVDEDGRARLDTSAVTGVDPDLVVKPFGWKGTFATLREMVGASLQVHLGLQAEEVVRSPERYGVELGEGPADDPDDDGVQREITEGQVTALVIYLATLDAPPLEAPEEAAYREPVLYSKELDVIRSPESTARWIRGYQLFKDVGCATCHVPFLSIEDPRLRTRAPGSATDVVVDLAADGAQPTPRRDEAGRSLVPMFSDLRRHNMGPRMISKHVDRGVPEHMWLTRPLWGAAQTSPYLHFGSAMTFDDAIVRHGGEAAAAAEAYGNLEIGDAESLRFFLGSLARAPAVRVR